MKRNNTCCIHDTLPTKRDASGLYWCEECEHRRQLMNWGDRHGYPDHQCSPFAIDQSYAGWITIGLLGSDECIWMALALCEYLDEGKQVYAEA